MKEIWKDIDGHFGSYRVSNLGRVKSMTRICSRGYEISGRILKPIPLKSGHQYVNLRKDGMKEFHLVHRLVLITFIGPPPAGTESLHSNGTPSDNKLINLRWGTRKENGQDQIKHGKSTKGERNPRAKLSTSQVSSILADRRLHREIAKQYSVSRECITSIKSKKRWSHI